MNNQIFLPKFRQTTNQIDSQFLSKLLHDITPYLNVCHCEVKQKRERDRKVLLANPLFHSQHHSLQKQFVVGLTGRSVKATPEERKA